MKKKTANQPQKTKERHWLSAILWADESDIQANVEAYDISPWYISVRFFLLCFVYGSFFLTAVLFHQWIEFIMLSVLFIPIAYLMMRGYRFTFILVAILKLYDSISRLFIMDQSHISGGSIVGILIWTALWLGLCITAYRIETARRSQNKKSKNITNLDKVFLCLFVIFAGLITYGVYSGRTDPKIQLENKYGVQNVAIAEDLYIHLVSIPDLCESSWQKVAEFYNNDEAEKLNANDITENYLQRYFTVNEDILSNVPEKLGEEFANLLGQETSNSFRKNAIKFTQKNLETKASDSDVVYMLCVMLLTADDEALKIDIK